MRLWTMVSLASPAPLAVSSVLGAPGRRRHRHALRFWQILNCAAIVFPSEFIRCRKDLSMALKFSGHDNIAQHFSTFLSVHSDNEYPLLGLLRGYILARLGTKMPENYRSNANSAFFRDSFRLLLRPLVHVSCTANSTYGQEASDGRQRRLSETCRRHTEGCTKRKNHGRMWNAQYLRTLYATETTVYSRTFLYRLCSLLRRSKFCPAFCKSGDGLAESGGRGPKSNQDDLVPRSRAAQMCAKQANI